MGSLIDLNGRRFGKLVVEKREGSTKFKKATWLCVCDCGNKKVVVGNSLLTGLTSSCGCFRKQNSSSINTTHGLSNHRLYRIFHGMHRRCEDPKIKYYYCYGGRGISVCEEWKNFEDFFKWANSSGYKPSLSIDRKDGDKDYSPDNCRWATNQEQALNHRNNVHVEINGQVKILSEWARFYGITDSAIRIRYKKGERGEILVRPLRKWH